MPTPEFIVDARRKLGHDLMWLPGVTAVVFDGDRVLLVQRSDSGDWTPVTGILDPGEEPAVGAVREVLEETGVIAVAEQLVSVKAGAPIRFPNGDLAQFLDLTFRCRYVSGRAHVADDESIDVGWFALDDLPDLVARHRERIGNADTADGRTRFVR
ncbi:MAG: NUDIX hydrolase [Jiangellaceae bacterium]